MFNFNTARPHSIGNKLKVSTSIAVKMIDLDI